MLAIHHTKLHTKLTSRFVDLPLQGKLESIILKKNMYTAQHVWKIYLKKNREKERVIGHCPFIHQITNSCAIRYLKCYKC